MLFNRVNGKCQKSKKWLWMMAIIVCLAIVVGVAQADWLEKQKLTASDAAADDGFGRSVSISGDYAIVAADGDDDDGRNSGSAYIFKHSDDANDPNWYQQAKLTASDANDDDWFGYSVSISGDYAIAGAYRHDTNGTNSGAAYIFKRSDDSNDPNWYQQLKLTPSDANQGDMFGHSVSIDGDYAIIGAPGADVLWTNSGAAYIFKRSDDPNDPNWYQQARLFDSLGHMHANFGYSVSISGNYCMIGAPYAVGLALQSGRLYIYKREGTSWLPLVGYYTPQDGAAYDRAGLSVSMSADFAIVGVPYDDDNGDESGSAYIYKRDGDSWSQYAKLTASDGATEDFFGGSVSITDNIAIVGASGDDDNGTNAGSAYIFKYTGNTWNEFLKLNASDGDAEDYFGASVSLSTEYAIVGALRGDNNEPNCGSAYIFERFSPPGDMDDDYCVNWHDVNVFTEQWLDPFQVKLTASDGDDFDWFGHSVSISDGYAIAGSPANSSAYIFKRNGKSWIQQPKLSTDPSQFGYSVSINADVAIVSALYDDDLGYMAGSAYIFERSDDANDPNWYQQDKLLASDGAPYQQFGLAVSLDANYAVVAAPGSAYIFEKSSDSNDPNWYEQIKLNAPDPSVQSFARSVSIYNDYLIVGADADDDKGPFSGSAFIYKRSADANDPNWYQQVKLLASDGNDYDYFGYSVSISGNYCLVGAYGDEPNGYNSGSAYIFKRSDNPDDPNWYEQAKLIASDSAENDMFGHYVSLSGDYAIIGAYANDDHGTNSGSAYIFKRSGDTWSEVYKIVPSDGSAMDFFGRCVSIGDDYAIIGAFYDDDKGSDSGSAYIFKKDCPTADLNDDCHVDFTDYAILANWWLQCN
ncbi:MAG: FG-GAP repeat protein [Planctomycetota bacterium]|jgi:hypothetical protein